MRQHQPLQSHVIKVHLYARFGTATFHVQDDAFSKRRVPDPLAQPKAAIIRLLLTQ